VTELELKLEDKELQRKNLLADLHNFKLSEGEIANQWLFAFGKLGQNHGNERFSD